MKKWITISSKYIVNDKWLKLRADSCLTKDGHLIEPFYVFEYNDWVNCFVIDSQYNVIMVKHYRYGANKNLIELVSGRVEDSDASPESAMKKELEEELGYIGGNIYQTGVSYPNPACQTNKIYSFLAIGGECKIKPTLEKGEDLELIIFNFKDVLNKFIHTNKKSTKIYQSLHIASIFFAINFIKISTNSSIKKLKQHLVESGLSL
jgi:ADP-ribose pyrophosphatase